MTGQKPGVFTREHFGGIGKWDSNGETGAPSTWAR